MWHIKFLKFGGPIMSRRKPIDAKILEASREFDARVFAETVKGEFTDFPDYRRNQKRILYLVW